MHVTAIQGETTSSYMRLSHKSTIVSTWHGIEWCAFVLTVSEREARLR